MRRARTQRFSRGGARGCRDGARGWIGWWCARARLARCWLRCARCCACRRWRGTGSCARATRIRGIFSKAFTARRIEALRPRIVAICESRLDAAASRGEVELMSELAAPLPVTVIAELLGFPSEDFARIKKWSDAMAEALGLN